MNEELKLKFLNIIENEIQNKKNNWNENSLFYRIRNLSIDQRGRVGEYLLCHTFEKLNFFVDYEIDKHGDYDIVVDKKWKIEVKLATLDKNNKFQHEGIKSSNKWNLIAFVDIAPNDIYVTFIPKKCFKFNDFNGSVKFLNINQNIHFRGKDNTTKRATGAGYKVDLKLKELNKIKDYTDIEKKFKIAINYK